MFCIKVSFPSDKDIVIDYPEDKINDIPPTKRHYKIIKDAILVNGGSTKIYCPDYCHRVLILFDIMVNVWSRKLHKIDYLCNGKTTKNIKGLIRKNISIDKSFHEQEQKMSVCILESLTTNDIIKVDKDIAYGYELIIDLIACRGIK